MRGAYAGNVLRKLPQLVVLDDEQRLVDMVWWENLAGQQTVQLVESDRGKSIRRAWVKENRHERSAAKECVGTGPSSSPLANARRSW
jgi:hypothetical protein